MVEGDLFFFFSEKLSLAQVLLPSKDANRLLGKHGVKKGRESCGRLWTFFDHNQSWCHGLKMMLNRVLK